MEADDKTIDWVRKHSDRAFKPVDPDPDAEYIQRLQVNASELVPQVACPHAVDNVVPLSDMAGTAIDLAVIGTCTNGRLEDLTIAAGILKGRRVSPKVRLIVAPASRRVLQEGIASGVVQILLEAGAALVTPGCGPCVGTHNGVPADEDVAFSTANRNFKGRMGNSNAFIYLEVRPQ